VRDPFSEGPVADPDATCPCLSGETYGACCGRYHRGEAAPTAVALMRSRYTAFAMHDAAYLLATWHASTRPLVQRLDPYMQWRRLDILETTRGGMLDTVGEVEFRAFWRTPFESGVLHERSRFRREGGRWFYLNGDVLE
jgi:SEC-C motif-containing protein